MLRRLHTNTHNRQVVKLRADLLRLSQDGASCLPTIKQHLLDAADSPDTLDIVFEAAGLGAILSGYASALLDDQVGTCVQAHVHETVGGVCLPC